MSAVLAVAVLWSSLHGDGTVGRWIDSLGHDDPAVRDDAFLHLKAAGRSAWPDLEAGAETHRDLEVRGRCREILSAVRLRRRLPWRVLDEFPTAVPTLQNGTSAERIALIKVLARTYDDTLDLLIELTQDPDPEVVIAAADVLQERRNTDWAPRLLEFYSREDCPRAGRAYELLTMTSSRLTAADLQRLFAAAGPRGRNRIVQLCMNANLPLGLSPAILRGFLEARDPSTRRLGLSWLRERGCAGALVFVEPLLSDPDPAVTAEALSTLRSCSWRPQAGAIEALLGHDDPSVREEAVQAALAFEDRSALPALRRLLEDPSMSVRQSAISALPRLGGAEAMDDLLRVFLRDSGETRDSAAAKLALSPEWALPRVRPLLADPDPDRRIRAYDLWARIENIRVLAPLARDRDETVRRWALQQLLRRQEAPGALEAVEGFTSDSCEPIRFDALRALVRLEKREHAPALEAFLASREYAFRFDAAETLLALKDERAQALARRLVEDADGPMRRLGYFALGERSDPEVADRALRELSDPDGRLGGAAAKYLRQLLTRGRDEPILARLSQGLDTWTGEPLDLAFSLIMEYGDASAAPAIRKLVLSGRAPRPERAVRALSDWAGDRAAVELAGLVGADASLNEYIYSRLREVRKRHPEAGRRELEAAFSRLFASLDRRVRRGAVAAAADLGLGGEGVAALVVDREPSVRCAAMGAARTLGVAAAADAILARIDDDDPDVRVAAVTSLVVLKPAARAAVERAIADEDCLWARHRMEGVLGTAAK